jgi:hypothetical protein
MHIQEKQAWLELAVMTATLTLFFVLVELVGQGRHSVAYAAFGLLGLAGAARLIGRRERKAGNVIMDERDHDIERTATLLGYGVLWALFVGAALAPFFILGANAVMPVPTDEFAMTPMVAVCALRLARSVVTISLYRRGSHGREV